MNKDKKRWHNAAIIFGGLIFALLANAAYKKLAVVGQDPTFRTVLENLVYSPLGTMLLFVTGIWYFLRTSKKKTVFFVTGIIYIATPMLFWIVKSELRPETFFKYAIWSFSIVWACDIFAYLGGRIFGGPKLAPTISPKKRL